MNAVRPGWARRGTRAVAVASLLAVVAVGCGGGDDGTRYVEPEGPANETLAIEGGNFFFDPAEASARPGIAELSLVGSGGIHTLVFDDAEFPGFRLEVAGDETDTKKIDLEPGVYGFYCDIAGHRQQGMEGTLRVK